MMMKINFSSNFSQLFFLQLFTRLITFTLNNFITRYLSPEIIGLTALKLELYVSSILFLSREWVRLVSLRYPQAKIEDCESCTKLSYLPLPFGVFFSFILTFIYLLNYPPLEISITDYAKCIIIYGISALIELLSEPIYNVLTSCNLIKERVVSELLSSFCRSVFIAASVSIGFDNSESMNLTALHIFSLGQLLYALSLMLCYSYLLKGYFAKIYSLNLILERFSMN